MASKIEQLDYINKTIPLIIDSFKELKIREVDDFHLTKDGFIQISKEGLHRDIWLLKD